MKVLFMHPNMPGQYKYLCKEFAKDPDNLVVFLTKSKNIEIEGVHRVTYGLQRRESPHCHRYMIHFERAVIQGQEAWRMLNKLKNEEGFVPDVICCHPGWGDALYVKDVYPDTPVLSFFEFFYHGVGVDVGFDPKDTRTEDDLARVRTKNAHHLLGMVSTDWGISPTHWQNSLNPPEFQHKISVLHDGINTNVAKPDQKRNVKVKPGVQFKHGDEVVTYIARNFEPYRGFPTFMKAAEKILKDRPNCHIIAIGADEVSYGRKAPKGTTYREMWMKKVDLDMDRMHFVGTLPYDHLISVLQVSAAHIYLTYPFVLSWSSMEAMACGCALVASDTQPVREVVTHGETGFLVDFFDHEALAEQIYEVLDHKTRMQHVRDAARKLMVDKYSLEKTMPLHVQLVKEIAEKKFPPPVDAKIRAIQGLETKKAA
ncbi:MAG: glycosyltransferase family 4 protein [Rickettsiales bacterium]|nr:glycosyltransferase family 4 protein [Rickettsiales bacterium]